MVGGGASMVISSMWASMAAWFTPTVLFCVVNLMIATIFIASNFKSSHDHHDGRQNTPGQLARAPSLLERVKSGNLSSFYTPHQYAGESETTGYGSMSGLGRTPSLLERVKSIDFSFSSFYATPTDQSHIYDHDYQSQPESEHRHSESPRQLSRAPSLLERVKSINFSSFYTQNYNSFPTESEKLNNSPGELARPSSFLERVKSFKVPSPFTSDHQSGDIFPSKDQHTDPDPHNDPFQDPDVTSSKSKKSGVTPAKKSSGNIKKSLSEKRLPASDDGEKDVDQWRPATMRASLPAKDENVDAKADDFINRFKQQLKLQRLDSLKKLKEMLNRGTSSA